MVLPIGPSDILISASFSNNGKYIITNCDDLKTRVYEVNSGVEIMTITGHTEYVTFAEFSLDDKYIVTASRDNSIRITEFQSGKLKALIMKHTDDINTVVFSKDLQYILTSSRDKTAKSFTIPDGKEVLSFEGNENIVSSAKYSFDGHFVLTSGYDETIRIFNSISGNQLKLLKGHGNKVLSCEIDNEGKLILTYDRDNRALLFDITNGEILYDFGIFSNGINSTKFTPDGKQLVIICNNEASFYEINQINNYPRIIFKIPNVRILQFNPNYKNFLTVGDDRIIRIYNSIDGKELFSFSDHKDRINSVKYNRLGDFIVTSCRDGTSIIYNLNSKKIFKIIKGKSLGLSSVNFGRDNNEILTANDEIIKLFNSYNFNSRCEITANNDKIKFAEFYQNNNLISKNYKDSIIRIYDIANKKQINQINNLSNVNSIQINQVNGDLLITCFDSIAYIYKNGVIKTKLNGHSDWITFARYSQNGELILTSSWDNKIRLYDSKSGNLLSILSGHVDYINSAEFNPSGDYIITASRDHTSFIYSVKNGRLVKKYNFDFEVIKAVFSPDGKKFLIGCDNGYVGMYNLKKYKLEKAFNAHNNSVIDVDFSLDGKLAVSTGWDNRIVLYNVKDRQVQNQLLLHTDFILHTCFNHDNKLFLSSGADQKTVLWSLQTGLPIYELIQIENNNWLVKLPNSPYYMCSKDASKMLHYVTPSLKVIGFEQLDPVYNRPDIVLDSIGKYFGGADQELVANYRQSWEKRIDRLGLDKEKLGKGEIAVPNAEIVGADAIAYENKNGKLDIKVAANDPKYPLRRFNVSVNEVPMYGSAGISIAHLKKQVWDTTVSVPLSIGENKIQVSVMNELGLENFKYPSYVNYAPSEPIVAKTYYIGIGVNEFQESSHNLKYCVKDVTDLSTSFGGPNTEVKLFTNAQVTKENIIAIKDYLSKTTVNDKVIISCSSHGLLDDSLNFYLAMHDVDFNNPKARGLKYEELESLLDGIPARQKLLLLDACNSGENDKTEVLKKELAQKEASMNTSQVVAARGAIVKLEEENKSNFKKMNELFVNVRNNTGSVIISAAGGQESALEAITLDGKSIENGAFSYCVLEYLKNNSNNPEELTVNKLKNYVEKRVEEITNGKQKPTSRQETMEVDWKVR